MPNTVNFSSSMYLKCRISIFNLFYFSMLTSFSKLLHCTYSWPWCSLNSSRSAVKLLATDQKSMSWNPSTAKLSLQWTLSKTLNLRLLSSINVNFFTGTVAEGAPIIPISAQLKYNIEVVCEYIVNKIPVPVRDFISEPRLIGKHRLLAAVWYKLLFYKEDFNQTFSFLAVIRSFDVNKPGCEVDDLKGGVAGGSILKGVLKVSFN